MTELPDIKENSSEEARRLAERVAKNSRAGWASPEKVNRNLPRLFLALALLLGVPFAFLNPPLQAPDEFAHFFRAYGVSEGQFVAHDLTQVPRSVVALAHEFPIHLETAHRIHAQDLLADLRTPLRESDSTGVPNEGMGMYSFVPYLASGAAIRLGRLFSAPALALLYLARLGNGLVYALLVFIALRLLPDFRVLLFSLALLPTALEQANSVSIDAITFSIAFLFCASLLRLAFDPAVARIGMAEHAAIIVPTCVAALCKADLILVALALLIPAAKFSSARVRWLSLACYAAIGLGVAATWGIVNEHNLKLFELRRLSMGISLTDNWHFVIEHPVLFAGAVLRTSQFHAFDLLDEFVSTIGWLAASIPRWVVLSYLAVLAAVAATQTRGTVVRAWQKSILFAVFVSGAAAVFIMLWGFCTPAAYVRDSVARGTGHVPEVQGRYFIPFALPLCLLLSNLWLRLHRAGIVAICVAVAVLGSGSAWTTIQHTFYGQGAASSYGQEAASSKFEGSLVRKSGATSEDQKVYFVQNGSRHWITSAEWITAHGMKWPGDVKTIDAGELDGIPLGASLP